MTTVDLSCPERSLLQRRQALERANVIRIARANIKRDIRGGAITVTELLEVPPLILGTMKVSELLLAIPHVGQVKVSKILRCCSVSPTKTIGGLSERQRRELIARLEPGARLPRKPRTAVGLKIHALSLSGAQPVNGVRSACGKVVPAERASLLPAAVSCPECRARRRLL